MNSPEAPEFIELVPYFKCYRSETARELIAAQPKAFLLLWQIVYRAQRTDSFNRYNLAVGEALIGDFKEIGLTEGQYRYAKKYLEKHGFATFRATTKGTVATLTNTEVFDPNLETNNGQHNTPATNEQRTSNEPTTTTKNDKKYKNDKLLNSNGSNGMSPNVLLITYTDKIKKMETKIEQHRQRYRTEAAGGAVHWDKGRREEYKAMKEQLKQLEIKRDEILEN